MPPVIPNLEELLDALEEGSAGHQLAGAFAADTIEQADDALRAVVGAWEQAGPPPATESSS